jgi:hypothetical protein
VAPDGTAFPLADEQNLIGRGERELSDPPKVNVGALPGGGTVSRHHARIFRKAGEWWLKVETEARNPTFLDGERVLGGDERPLADNARIRMGDLDIVFRAPEEASAVVEAPPEEAPAPPPAAAPATIAPPPPEPIPSLLALAEWPKRLPPRPSTLKAVGVSEFRRVNAFRGLMIDSETWSDAHEYHRQLARLHLLSGHGWGIVEGLEVVIDTQEPNTLVVRAGVAVDALGRSLLVSQDRRLTVTAAEGATLYIGVQAREELAEPQRYWGDADEYTRVIEKAEVQLLSAPPTPPALELARVLVNGPLANAATPLDPKPGEVDLRFRERLLVRPRPDLVVAQLEVGPTDDPTAERHRSGLRFLLREIGATTPYRPRWAGLVKLGEPVPPASLLYLTGKAGFEITNLGLSYLRAFLDSGGVLFADGCLPDGGAFVGAIRALALALDRELEPVDRRHPLFLARHVFARVPRPEPEGSALVAGNGLVLSGADYGCAWQGGTDEEPLPRQAIREALEFGVNLAVYARQRQRPLEALELEV